ncbi:MAG: ABC transporter permease [Planctomycetes bacterium]|nr:ABC transporter permease [Planctomycetota bacterium]
MAGSVFNQLQGILPFCRSILALFFRSLRTESRSLRMHLLWLMLMLVIYATLWFARKSTSMFGAPGLMFFRYVMYMNAAFITMLGVSFFSSAISEEKEEDTLGLMTMAGISPLGILFGKSTSRLFQVSLLLAIQYPFTLLAVTMGGLLPTQVFSAYVSLLAYTILLANVGLLCSVACRTTRNASGLTAFWLLGYLTGPAFAFGGYMYLTRERGWDHADFLQNLVLSVLDWLWRATVFVDLYSATETGHQFSWTPQIVGNSIGGLACFLLAWCLFGIVAKDPAPESSSRGTVAQKNHRYLYVFSAGRTWGDPLIWKDFFFTAGGTAGLMIRGLLYGGMYLLCIAANRPWNGAYDNIRWEDVTWGFQFFCIPLLAVDVGLCASRVFQEEIRGQTLSSLMMLPKSTMTIVYSKVSGCGLATLPGFAAIAISIMMPGGWRNAMDVIDQAAFWWFIMNLLLIVHLAALFSLYLRTGAFVLSLGLVIGSMIVSGIIMELWMSAWRRPFGSWNTPALAMCIFIGFICLACHLLTVLRMPQLAEK